MEIFEIPGAKYREVPAKTNDKICKDCDYFKDCGKCTLDVCPCEGDDTILERVEDKMTTLEKMEEVLGPAMDGERRMILKGKLEERKKKIEEILKDNFSFTIWTTGWSKEEIVEESRLLTEWDLTWCWDETMNAFLVFRCEKDLQGFYSKLKEYNPSINFNFSKNF